MKDTSRQRSSISIGGMSCGHCMTAVKRALAAVPGTDVELVVVGNATVVADAQGVVRAIKAIKDAGYEAQVASGTGGDAASGCCCG